MPYLAMTFWLMVIVFSALGVYQLWTALVKPRVINSLLLPGTLVAQLGRVVGLLITGGTVENTSLITDDESGEPQTGGKTEARIPVIGPILIALLPMLSCAIAIYAVAQYMGQPIIAQMATESVPQQLPTSLHEVWPLLRNSVTLVERFVDATLASPLHDWHTWLFLYLAICLTVRMAPLPGTQRGALGAIVIVGLVFAILNWASAGQHAPSLLDQSWPLITFSVATLLFLLLATLVAYGAVRSTKILMGKESAS